MRPRAVLVACLVVVSIAGLALGAQPRREVIDIREFQPRRAAQRTVVWCWAACVAMIVNHVAGDRVVTQEHIVTRNYGMAVALPAFSWEQIRRNLNVLVPNARGNDLQLVATSHAGVLAAAAVERELRAKRPFLIGINGQSHVVVCYGAQILTDAFGHKTLQAIHIFDPWPFRGDRWLRRQEWPGHVTYRWETTITIQTRPSHFVSHPALIGGRIAVGRWQIVGLGPGGYRIRVLWTLRGGRLPAAVWTRTFRVDPFTGALTWADTRCRIVGPVSRGEQAFLLYDTRLAPPIQGVNILALEYD